MGNLDDLEHALRRELAGEVRFDPTTRKIYSTDASMYAIEPIGVVFPRHADDISMAVRVAGAHDVAVLPRGAATSLAGQTVGKALILDCSRHLTDVKIDAEARSAVVQPGVVQDHLNRQAAKDHLIFGPDTSTASRATLGGMIGNNSGGTHSVVYGMTIDHVRSLDVVLSDGSAAILGPMSADEVARRANQSGLEGSLYREIPKLLAAHRGVIASSYPEHWRRSGGYRLDRMPDDGGLDLAKLVTGSEGTLVVISKATVGLVPRPAVSAIAVGHFTSTSRAIAATTDALSGSPSAVELLDSTIIELALKRRELAGIGSVLEGHPAALLFVSFTGDTEDEAAAKVDQLAAAWKRSGHGYATLRAITPAEQAPLLKVRSSALGLLMASASGSRRPLAFVEDTAVDPTHLAEYADRFQAILDRRGVRAGFYGHCSVGCLHVRPFIDLSSPQEVATMRAISEEILELAAEYGGSNSSEHGDGLVRTEFNRRLFGDELYGAMRELKAIFDPHNRMNPGKIVDGPSMTDHLRDPAVRIRVPVETRLHFPEGTMFDAADRCMRIGACRKSGEATMCPSYMATLDEQHSTRGRANALAMALSSDDPLRALGDDGLHEVLDLCLECKACKTECPLSVDMAALKVETLAHYYDVHGVPLSARAFGAIRALNRWGARVAPIANAILRFPPARVAMERVLGIDRRRSLPKLTRKTLPRLWREGLASRGIHNDSDVDAKDKVIVLADSFTSFTEPSIGQAALELLSRAGFSVELEASLCCGRPEISKGLLDKARHRAALLSDRLGEAAEAGARIVGWEPSCILTLTDEHVAFAPQSERARAVARQSTLVDDLLLEAINDGRLVVPSDSPLSGKRIVYHGHCHQKSLVGTSSTLGLLRAIPGAEVVEIDAGCCGMAGSFGFEADHYELSMAIGGQRLFPAVNAEPDTTILAATGVSCRQQIAHGTGRRPIHPIEILSRAFASGEPGGS